MKKGVFLGTAICMVAFASAAMAVTWPWHASKVNGVYSNIEAGYSNIDLKTHYECPVSGGGSVRYSWIRIPTTYTDAQQDRAVRLATAARLAGMDIIIQGRYTGSYCQLTKIKLPG